MRILICVFLISVLASGCKNDDMDYSSAADIQQITGTWKLTGEEQGLIGQTTWTTVKSDSIYDVTFRNDGVVMSHTGLPACCAPTSLTINGALFEIKPNAPVAANPACATVFCTNCPNWGITLSGSEMIISYCNSSRKKYERR